MATTYLDPAEAIAEIKENVVTIRGKPADDKLELYARYFVGEVLDYCNRDAFPQVLCMAGAALIIRWLDDLEYGGRSALKSIKQDDTEYQFAVAEVPQTGSTLESDLYALRPRLNLYRKVRWRE